MRAWGARGQIIILVYMASNFKVYHLMKYILILNYIHKLIVVKLKKILSISCSKIKKKNVLICFKGNQLEGKKC